MPLPSLNLDDRHFDDLLEEARRLIPRYCPEWTDHNPSDPGMAIIEIFAWMTDLLLYRVNRIPEKVLLTFLNLLGLQPKPPQAAAAGVTFYLSAPQEQPLTIPAGTEVATLRTEVDEAISFSTERPATILPPRIGGLYTANILPNVSGDEERGVVRHDLAQLGLTGYTVPIFQPQPQTGDSFFIQLLDDHSYHVLGLHFQVEWAGGAGVNPERPPYLWEVWQAGAARWAPCEVEYDGTYAFNDSGELVLRLPQMREGEFFGEQGYWLRCRLTNEQMHNGYRVSPDLEGVRPEAKGITTTARHATVVRQEILGESSGLPGQRFLLSHGPVLSLDPSQDWLEVIGRDGLADTYTLVHDFSRSGADDAHFSLDTASGEVALGPTILQPDGNIYRFGRIPPVGATLRMSRYQFGGGLVGNVPAQSLNVLKSSMPYVARVINHRPAAGGQNAQSLDSLIHELPEVLRTRTRAVTADDYEYLATRVEGVARARCVTPNMRVPGQTYPGQIRALEVPPGHVTVALLPDIPERVGLLLSNDPAQLRVVPERLTLSAELRGRVQQELDARRLVGTVLDLRAPQYVWVSVIATIRVMSETSRMTREEVKRQCLQALYLYLNPYVGGPDRQGWPFGRDLNISELYSLLRAVPSVEVVEDLQVILTEPSQPEQREKIVKILPLPPQALIVSDFHQVRVEG